MKKLVLFNVGLKVIIPSDCKRVALVVSKKVNKNLSETTIKRFFGFALSEHNFSEFTLTALCEYVGLESWKRFCEMNESYASLTDFEGEEFITKANMITRSTLETIQTQSGVPNEMSIMREFAENGFDLFLKSESTFVCMFAPARYGKSTLLSNLVTKLFIDKDSKYGETTCLFLNTNIFKHTKGTVLDFEKLISSLFGLSGEKSFLDFFEEHFQDQSKQLLLIIDGIDRDSLAEMPNSIFDSLACFINRNRYRKWLKISLSVRSFCWSIFREKINNSTHLQQSWFSMGTCNEKNWSNIPPLSLTELEQILKPIYGRPLCEMSPKLLSHLKFPFNINIYYKLKQENPAFDETVEVSNFELIARFVQEVFTFSKNYTEKVILIKYFIEITNYGLEGTKVCKASILDKTRFFITAYEELLIDGILIEENDYGSSDQFFPLETVRFLTDDIFYYFLFLDIFETSQQSDKPDFFCRILNSYPDSPTKTTLLELSAWYLVNTQDFSAFGRMLDLPFTSREKQSFVLYAIDTLKFLDCTQKELSNSQMKKHGLYQRFILELIHLDFTAPKLYQHILSLLKISDNDNDIALCHFLAAGIELWKRDNCTLDNQFILDYCNKNYLMAVPSKRMA